MKEKILSWSVQDVGTTQKTSAWYWAVGIIAVGSAVASIIGGNILLGVLAIIGAFAVMLAGSRPPVQRTYGLSESGIFVGNELIPFNKIKRFAINEEEEEKTLALSTQSISGTVTVPLGDADFRMVRSELKNRNVEEVDALGSVAEKVAERIGM